MILTTKNRYQNAIRFKEHNGDNTWLIIGGTTPWPNENLPPSPSPTATPADITDKFCAVKAEVRWVIEDPEGSLDYVDALGAHVKFSELQTLQDALDSEDVPIVWLYAEATGAELGVSGYRIIGFTTGLEPTAGHENDTFLVAGDVADWGVLETLEYHKLRSVQTAGSYSETQLIDY